MAQLPLVKAQLALSAALEYARKRALAPMTVAVLDARGVLKAFAAEDGTPCAVPISPSEKRMEH
jgi:uncharacterized protein GlcG (DUF336 family)